MLRLTLRDQENGTIVYQANICDAFTLAELNEAIEPFAVLNENGSAQTYVRKSLLESIKPSADPEMRDRTDSVLNEYDHSATNNQGPCKKYTS